MLNKNTQRNLLLLTLAAGFVWVFFLCITPRLPTAADPIRFYSNQSRQDIKLLFTSAIRGAQESIDIHMYGITDPHIISTLARKAAQGTRISLEYDPTASSLPLLKTLPSTVHLHASVSKGLMHRKILIIDQATLFLGSANLTTASLRHHDNLVVGLHSPALAAFLLSPTSPCFLFSAQGSQGEIWLLPDKDNQALDRLVRFLSSAQRSIQIAMFTLTHPQIADALIAAHTRGVAVTIAVDYFTGRGASKKCLEKLNQAGIPILLSQGQELLHHKWALIDEQSLVMGSANWTKAAFQKNEDFLLFFTTLSSSQTTFLKNLWKTINLESF